MAEIYVYFSKRDGVFVFPDPAPVFSGENIHWRVQSDNRSVRSVRITFSKSKPPLVFSSGPRTGPGKEIFYTRSGGATVLWGIAPIVGRPRALKYTVAGLTTKGKTAEGALLDPVIIIEPPAPGPIVVPQTMTQTI